MADAAHRRATYQDVLDAPENLIAEIIDGELFVSNAPHWHHQFAADEVRTALGIWSRTSNAGDLC